MSPKKEACGLTVGENTGGKAGGTKKKQGSGNEDGEEDTYFDAMRAELVERAAHTKVIQRLEIVRHGLLGTVGKAHLTLACAQTCTSERCRMLES